MTIAMCSFVFASDWELYAIEAQKRSEKAAPLMVTAANVDVPHDTLDPANTHILATNHPNDSNVADSIAS